MAGDQMKNVMRNWNWKMAAVLSFWLLGSTLPSLGQITRVLGIDVSTYQGNLSTTTWATFKLPTAQGGDGRDFVLLRSSRGGTTGEDHR